jgi:Domain of unknown function (DUF4129)
LIRSLRSSPDLLAPLLVCLALAFPAGAQERSASPEDVRQKALAVLEDPGYQTALPAGRQVRDQISPGGTDEGGASSPVLVPALGALAPLATLVLYVLIAAAVLLILSWIALEAVNRRRGRGPQPGPKAEPGEEGEAAPGRDAALDDASRLAAQGRYGEAIHVLLLVAIRRLAERSRTTLPPSRTSRELVRLLPLGAESRESFAELVRSVELSLFGGVAAGPEDYERSLARFHSLVRRPA